MLLRQHTEENRRISSAAAAQHFSENPPRRSNIALPQRCAEDTKKFELFAEKIGEIYGRLHRVRRLHYGSNQFYQ